MTVNGQVVTEPGAVADPRRDRIAVDGRPIPPPEPKQYLILHKPSGYVTTRHDPRGRPVVLDLVPAPAARLFPVGRLDFDTEGLLLLTNDGPMAHRLLHPRYGIPRVYEVEIERPVSPTDLERFRRGAVLEDGVAKPKDARLIMRGRDATWLRLTFAEGRYREVRRFCSALGYQVRRLRRVQFGPLRLGRLAPGASRRLTPEEIGRLRAFVGS